MQNLNLYTNNAWKWHQSDCQTIWVKGYLVLSDKIIADAELLDFSQEIIDNKLDNGCFVLIQQNSEATTIITDKLNSFPLFYSIDSKTLEIRDNLPIKLFKSQTSDKLISKKFEDFTDNQKIFCASGYLWNDETLNTQYKVTKAACKYIFKANIDKPQIIQLKQHPYFTTPKSKESTTTLIDKLNKCSQSIFSKIANFAKTNNQRLVIPLTGGLDSRYILTQLVDLGVENIFTFTYGRKDSFEIRLAQQVAKKLNIEWQPIYYDQQIWGIYFEKEYHAYTNECFNGISLPYEQDFPALYQLTKNKILTSNDIVLPGYSADMLAYGSLPTAEKWDNIHVSKEGLLHYLFYSDRMVSQQIQPKYLKQLYKIWIAQNQDDLPEIQTEDQFVDGILTLRTKLRVARYQINGLKAQAHFGIKYLLPFWDDEFVEFWCSIDNARRTDKGLYKAFLQSHLFDKYELNFFDKNPIRQHKHKSIKNIVRKNAPKFVKNFFKKSTRYQAQFDVNDLNTIKSKILDNFTEAEKQELEISDNTDLLFLEALYLLRSL